MYRATVDKGGIKTNYVYDVIVRSVLYSIIVFYHGYGND